VFNILFNRVYFRTSTQRHTIVKNRTEPLIIIVLVVFASMAMSACTSSKAVSENAGSETQDAQLEELFWTRMDEAKTRFTQADVDFMTGMIGHHAQALIMSGMAPTNDASPEIQILTSRIINAQKDEIATMQNWLRDRDQTVPEVHIDGTMLMVHGGGDHAMHMPGMLTQEQLDELSAARGVDYDRLFLTYMIQHHQGAVAMVKELFSKDGAGQDELAFKVANDINVDQLTEIARMQLMLKALSETN
jgi:uncharacterized protein (DUF305 family)